MPVVPITYNYTASTPQQLFTEISNDGNIDWCTPWGSLGQSRKNQLRPIFLKLLDLMTGGDHLSFINDILSPMDVAKHIYPANEVISIDMMMYK